MQDKIVQEEPNKIMFLVEQQSAWTMNIIIRALMYLVQTYHDYFEEQEADLSGGRHGNHSYL